MNKEQLLEAIKSILELTLPYIKELIQSKVVPALKRKVYEKVDTKLDSVIKDLAQNASKIAREISKDKLLLRPWQRLIGGQMLNQVQHDIPSYEGMQPPVTLHSFQDLSHDEISRQAPKDKLLKREIFQ